MDNKSNNPMYMAIPLSDDSPVQYLINITPAQNGYVLDIMEAPPIQRAPKMKDMAKMMDHIKKSAEGNEIEKIRAANEEKEDSGKPKIVPGTMIFHKFNELMAYVSFIYEEHMDKIGDKSRMPVAPEKKFNSHMQ